MTEQMKTMAHETGVEPVSEDVCGAFQLNEHLPYLLARTTGRMALVFSAQTSELDLTLKMWRVLSVLLEFGELRLRDLADLTSIDTSTLSRLVITMNKRRLVGRRRSLKSKREIVITLAPAGRERLEQLIPAAESHVASMTVGIPADDIAVTKATLQKIFENLDSLASRTSGVKESLLKSL